jgi:uncharacterized protein YndB with AHSA1/START domain
VTSYSFTAAWTVEAPVEAVAETVLDLEHYPEWWPQVRAVAKLGPDTARVLCRSVLPYSLDLVLDAVSRELPTVEVALGGDLDGWVRWTLVPHGDGTRMDYAQEVRVGGMLAAASSVARPLLAWNHRRMMLGCERGLRARLENA